VGWCTVKTMQVRRDKYISNDIRILNAREAEIGRLAAQSTADDKTLIHFTSRLPYVVVITPDGTGKIDFRYSGQSWNSDKRDRCTVGKWTNDGDEWRREVSCGFAC
jgi:hypothetical protein